MKSKFIMKKLQVGVIAALMVALLPSNIALAASDLTGFKQEVISNMTNRNTTFVVNYTGDTSELVNNFSSIVKEAYSSDDYLQWSWTYIKPSISGVQGNVDVTFNITYLTTKEQEAYVDERVAQIVASTITPNMTDIEKITALHDYVCKAITYDNSLTKRSAYEALSSGTVVCQGYAMLMDKLLEKAGFQDTIITGSLDGVAHAWNLVNYNGNWYHLDATNNDANSSKFLFMLSDTDLRNYSFTWTSSNYPAATKTYVAGTTTSTPTPTVTTTPTPTATPTSKPTATPTPTPTTGGTSTGSPTVTATPTVSEETNVSSELDDASLKQEMLNNIERAKKYIALAESRNSVNYLDVAQSFVSKLTADYSEKATLQSQIDSLRVSIPLKVEQEKVTKATNAVIKLELTLKKSYISTAESYVKVLAEGEVKTNLTNRIATVKAKITANEKQEAITKAVTAVEKLESTLKESYVSTAEKYVNVLETSDLKTSLLKRITVAKTTIAEKEKQEAIAKAVSYVEKLETTQKSSYIERATKYVSALEQSTLKTSLLKRISVMEKKIAAIEEKEAITKATSYVVKAETKKTERYITLAKKYIAEITDSDTKAALLKRINAIKVK